MIIFYLLITFALGQIAINNPVAGTVWKASENATITWVKTGNETDNNIKVDFYLVQGEPNSFIQRAHLGTAPLSRGSIQVSLDENLEQGDNYSVKYDAGSDRMNYSHSFTIQGRKKSKVSPTEVNDAKPTTTTSSTSTITTSTRTSSPLPDAEPPKLKHSSQSHAVIPALYFSLLVSTLSFFG